MATRQGSQDREAGSWQTDLVDDEVGLASWLVRQDRGPVTATYDEVDCFICDREYRRIRVAAGDRWHNGCVDDPKTQDGADLEIWRNYGMLIGLTPHPASTHRMIIGFDRLPTMDSEIHVGRDIGTRKQLFVHHLPDRADRQYQIGRASCRERV